MVEFQPYYGQIVVEVLREGAVGEDGIRAKQAKGGIWLPQGGAKATSHTTRGIIIAIGPQRQLRFEVDATGQKVGIVPGTCIDRRIKLGDDVIYKNYGCYEVELDGKSFVFVDETSILSVITETPDCPDHPGEPPCVPNAKLVVDGDPHARATELATEANRQLQQAIDEGMDIKDGAVIVNTGVDAPLPAETRSEPAGVS